TAAFSSGNCANGWHFPKCRFSFTCAGIIAASSARKSANRREKPHRKLPHAPKRAHLHGPKQTHAAPPPPKNAAAPERARLLRRCMEAKSLFAGGCAAHKSRGNPQ